MIAGYRVDAPQFDETPFQALVSVEIETRPCAPVLQKLRMLRGVGAVFSVSGEQDAVLHVSASSSRELSTLIDQIAAVRDIGKVSSQIILASYT